MQKAAGEFLSQLSTESLTNLHKKACAKKPSQSGESGKTQKIMDVYSPYDLLQRAEMTKDFMAKALVSSILSGMGKQGEDYSKDDKDSLYRNKKKASDAQLQWELLKFWDRVVSDILYLCALCMMKTLS